MPNKYVNLDTVNIAATVKIIRMQPTYELYEINRNLRKITKNEKKI
jgi:hypothetical protein